MILSLRYQANLTRDAVDLLCKKLRESLVGNFIKPINRAVIELLESLKSSIPEEYHETIEEKMDKVNGWFENADKLFKSIDTEYKRKKVLLHLGYLVE